MFSYTQRGLHAGRRRYGVQPRSQVRLSTEYIVAVIKPRKVTSTSYSLCVNQRHITRPAPCRESTALSGIPWQKAAPTIASSRAENSNDQPASFGDLQLV